MRTETITGTLRGHNYGVSRTLPGKGTSIIVTNDEPLADEVDGQKPDGRQLTTSAIVSFHDVDGGRQVTTRSGSIYFIEPIK